MSKVTVDKARFISLLNAEEMLSCLESGGVDNWDWYCESLKEQREIVDCDENGENVVYGKKDE